MRVSLDICSLYLFTYLLIDLVTYVFIYLSLISSLSHLFICSCIYLVGYLFLRLFIFIYLIIYLFI